MDRRIGLARQFQSTLPARGATLGGGKAALDHTISIHAPREGSDPPEPEAMPPRNISIHAPREGSDDQQKGDAQEEGISIHAPREGSDCPWSAAE